jgi:hypothetical protein
MKRAIAILLGLALVAGAGLAQARGGSGGHGGGGHMGGGHMGGGRMGSPGMGHFAGGPMHFTGGQTHFTGRPPVFTGRPPVFTTGGRPVGARPIVGVRPPVFVGRPPFFPHNRVIVGTTVVVGAPFYWYPPYYPYPYVAPAYGGSYEPTPTYVEQGSEIRYYCPDYRDYYPNVASCPSPWLQVVPDTGSYSSPPQ